LASRQFIGLYPHQIAGALQAVDPQHLRCGIGLVRGRLITRVRDTSRGK